MPEILTFKHCSPLY